jgi:ADP-heptose:LPS heptosyltransferase
MDQTAAEKTKRLIIVIKMPDPLLERLMSFPAIHLLRESFPEADFHFICSEYKIEMLYTLPFEGFWHPWKDDEIKSVLDVHRFVTFLNIGNVDIFISLGESLNEISLGKFLGAKKRVGFAEGWKKWFTTFSVKKPMGHHLSDSYLYLYKEFTNKKIPERLQIHSREMIPFFEEETPFLAIDLYPFPAGRIDEFWINTINCFTEKKFVFFFSEEEGRGALLIDRFIEKLSTKNKYEFFTKSNLIDMGKMMAQAKGVVTRTPFIGSYATYLGTDALIIYETGEPRQDAPVPFYANWQIMDLRDPTLKQATPESASAMKAKPVVNSDELLRKIHQMFYF